MMMRIDPHTRHITYPTWTWTGATHYSSHLLISTRSPLPDRPSPPLECIFGHIPFSRRWDTVRYSGIQLDTARYVWIQLNTVGVGVGVGYSMTAWDTVDLLQKMARYTSIQQGYTGYQGYCEIQAGYRCKTGGISQNSRQGSAYRRPKEGRSPHPHPPAPTAHSTHPTGEQVHAHPVCSSHHTPLARLRGRSRSNYIYITTAAAKTRETRSRKLGSPKEGPYELDIVSE